MNSHSIILVGGPDSGKTNYLARLWAALRSRTGILGAPDIPREIKYVEDALSHLLQGHFAPRSEKSLEEGHSFSVPVQSMSAEGDRFHIVVPDVSGELWKNTVETCELPTQWMNHLNNARGALLFVRIGSDQNVDPLDWVATAQLLRIVPAAPDLGNETRYEIPTQVHLCELLRFLEHSLGKSNADERPRIAVLVTAYDRLDAEQAAAGPFAYLEAEYPLFAGRLKDITQLDIKVFGVSIVGGDFIDEEFKTAFFNADLKTAGYVLQGSDGTIEKQLDLTLPVAWVVGATKDQ